GDFMDKFVYRLPWRTISLLLLSWIFFILLNFGILETGVYTDAPQWFPISIFFGPTIHLKGIPYLILFLLVLFLAIKNVSRLKIYHVWFLGLCLIILGNLGQGD